jgi:hypothetical protein
MKRMGKMWFDYEGMNAEFEPATTEQLQELLLACMESPLDTVGVKREILGGIIGELQRWRELVIEEHGGVPPPPFPKK